MTEQQSYIFDGVSVVKTGRRAVKQLKSGKCDELIEVTPQDPSMGSWKKWVRESELYVII